MTLFLLLFFNLSSLPRIRKLSTLAKEETKPARGQTVVFSSDQKVTPLLDHLEPGKVDHLTYSSATDDPDITGCDDNEIVRNPIAVLIGEYHILLMGCFDTKIAVT